MRRAVGGGSAVGCGVFGLGGLLVSVVLVVWLGSQALDGTSGVIGGAATTTTEAPLALDGATLAVAPAEGLRDGTELTVTGSDLPPVAVTLTVCLAHAASPDGDPCDPTTTSAAVVDPGGHLAATRTVPRVIEVGGIAYDCAAAAGACVLRAEAPDAAGDASLDAPLVFAPGLPPADAQTPPTG